MEGLLSCSVPQLPPLGNEAHAQCQTYRATVRTEWGNIHAGLRTAPVGTRAPAGVAPATLSSSPSPEAQHPGKPTAQGGRGAEAPTWGCTSSSQTPAMSARASGVTVMSLGFAAVSWASVPTLDGTVCERAPGANISMWMCAGHGWGLCRSKNLSHGPRCCRRRVALGTGGTHRAHVQEGARAAERRLVGVVLTQRREEAGKQTVWAWGVKSG